MDQIAIGQNLKMLRKEQGLTQEQLADKMGVARRTVSRWETGSNLPDLDILIELSDLYSVDLRELLDGERKENKMDNEMRETVLKVAEYSNEAREHTTKVARFFFVVGMLVMVANLIMEVTDFNESAMGSFVKGMTIGMAFAIMVMGLLYTTGQLEKIYVFKQRIKGRSEK